MRQGNALDRCPSKAICSLDSFRRKKTQGNSHTTKEVKPLPGEHKVMRKREREEDRERGREEGMERERSPIKRMKCVPDHETRRVRI